jgi:putative aminopeptidase FrvX
MNYPLLQKLTQTHAVTGDTAQVKNFLKTELKKREISYTENGFGSILFGNLKNPNKLFTSHIDEVGFQITSIEDNGKIRFLPVGWIFSNRIDHSPVYVFVNKQYVPGVVIHEEELKAQNILDFHNLFIDVGKDSREEVEKLGIRPGVTGSFAKNYIETDSVVMASSIDNKISQFVLFDIIDSNPEVVKEHMFAFVTDEEMQDHSANGICHSYKPDLAIVLDYCPTHQKLGFGDILGEVNKSPIIMYRGGSYILNEKVREYLENKIKTPFQIGFLSSNTLPQLEPSNFEDNGHTVAVNVCITSRGYHGATYITRKKDIEDFRNIILEIMKKPF